jgi:hypothetical protein
VEPCQVTWSGAEELTIFVPPAQPRRTYEVDRMHSEGLRIEIESPCP